MVKASAMIRGLASAALCLSASAGMAQPADSPLKSAMKLLGFATDVGPPADFVAKSRPNGDVDYIPIFQPPPEPARPVLGEKQLKETQGSLDSVEKRADALRQGFPPVAKATVVQQAADKKAKAKPAASNQ